MHVCVSDCMLTFMCMFEHTYILYVCIRAYARKYMHTVCTCMQYVHAYSMYVRTYIRIHVRCSNTTMSAADIIRGAGILHYMSDDELGNVDQVIICGKP